MGGVITQEYMERYQEKLDEAIKNYIATHGGEGGSSTLEELEDTEITSPSSGQILEYNGTKWVNESAPSGDLEGLTDTQITTPVNKQVLMYNGTKWVNTTERILLNQTLSAGSTSVTFSSGIPTSGDYEVSVFTDKAGLDYISMTSSNNSVTVTFEAQSSAVTVYLEYRAI